MRRLIGVTFFLLITVSAFAQVKITVLDQTTNKSLEGVSVAVKRGDVHQLFLTDEDGSVSFTSTAFPVTVYATHIGFAGQELQIPSAGEYTINLVATSSQLDEIVVTGQFESQSVRQSVYQVRTINSDRIMLRAPVSLQGVLSTELGIRFSNDLTLGLGDISLMGMSGRNVKILLDGVPLLDRGDARESLNQIDVNTIERIEIVEGPMSVVYGTDALAGVINIITKKYDDKSLAIDARIHEETAGKEYEAFTGKGVHNQSVGVNGGFKKLYGGAGVTRNTFGGWNEGRSLYVVNPYGDGEWHPKDQWLTTTTLGYKNDDFNIWYRLNYLKETISASGNAVNETQTVFTDKDYITNRFTHQLQADWNINDRLTFNGAASYQDLSRKTQTTNFDKTTGEETLSVEPGSQSEAMIDNAMVRGFFLYKLSSKISLQPGFEFNFSTASGDRIDRERTISDYAGFVSVEFRPTESVNIRPGVRFIHNTAYDAPPVIPSLNTKFILSESLDLRASYAYGFRSPGLRELYFYFYDANHSIEGNPDLKAEHSNSFAVSLTRNSSQNNPVRVKSTLGTFFNVFDNMITMAQYQNTTVFKYINVLKHKTTGATLENSIYWKNLTVTLGGSYIGNYNDFSEEDNSLPEFTWNTEINTVTSYSFPKLKNRVSVYYKFTGKRQSYTTNGTEVQLGEVEDFHMMDVSTSQSLLKSLTLTLGVRNLLDVTQLTSTTQDSSGGGHASSSGSVSMSYGRSYFATLSFQLSK